MTSKSVIQSGVYEGYYWEDVAIRDPGYVIEHPQEAPVWAYDKAREQLDISYLNDPYEDYRYAQDQARAFGFVRETYDE